MELLNSYHVLRVLGKGGEGTVYLVENKAGLEKQVLKVFHEPHTKDYLAALVAYADKINTNEFGLPDITLFYNNDKIIGVAYPYIPLSSLHWRILHTDGKVPQSFVGSYCQKQFYLMSQFGLAIWDPHLINFMVDSDGQWHYTDVSGGLCLLDHPWFRKIGAIGYGFASMLMSIYKEDLHHSMRYIENYSYESTCIYCNNERLDAISRKHAWVNKILIEIRNQKSSLFYDPEFYKRIGEGLPNHVPWPSLVLPFSHVLSSLGKLRGKIGI